MRAPDDNPEGLEEYDPLHYDLLSLDALLARAAITKDNAEMIRIHAIILHRYSVGRDDEILARARDELEKYRARLYKDFARQAATLTELEITLLSPSTPESIAEEEQRIALFKQGEE